MNKKIIYFGVLAVMALLMALAGVARAEPPPASVIISSPEYSTQNAWVSGWTPITPVQLITFNHNLGGDINQYAVELIFRDSSGTLGINTRNYGGLEYSGNYFGAHWQNLTTSSIQVFRHPNDISIDEVRVAIFIRDEPVDYDSGWIDMPAGPLTITHTLGIDPTELGVTLWLSDTLRGINHYAYGGLFEAAPPQLYGAYWHNLTEDTIQVTVQQTEQVRVTIVHSDPPAYDSLAELGGWQAIDQGSVFTFTHALGVDPNFLIVGSQCYDPSEGGLGIHQAFAGGFHDGLNRWQGSNWQNLTDETVQIIRRQDDTVCPQARILIWTPTAATTDTYLPTVLRNPIRTQTLAYDDGTSESSQSHDPDSGFAVLFQTPGASANLLAARYYLLVGGGSFPIEIHVWDAERNDLIVPFEVTPPAGEGWYEVDLSSYALTVSGEFYVGYLYPQASYDPSIGVDTTTPADRSYEVPWILMPNNYMIQAVIELLP